MTRPLRVLFAGTPDFAERHLDALLSSDHQVVAVLTQPDRPAGRGKKLTPSPVKRRAEQAGLAVLQPTGLKSEEVQQQLAALDADVMVVVAYGLILPQAVLDIPRFGCLNVHASLLPRWRGAAPIQRAVEAGDKHSGVTIMCMEAGLDTGPMLALSTLELADDETGGSLHDRLADIGPSALLNVLADLESHLANAQIQDHNAATYAHKLTKDECELDWQQDARQLEHRVRAFNPVPVCFSHLGAERVKIWRAYATESPMRDSPAAPGTILSADRNGIVVQCAEGALVITEAQFPGGRPLDIAALLNGKGDALTPGQRFLMPGAQR